MVLIACYIGFYRCDSDFEILMFPLIKAVQGGDIHQIGFLYHHLFMKGLLLATAQDLFGRTVFSRVHRYILAMIVELTQDHLQVLYMIIRY